ncbi:hypothetical protein EHS25_002710 [Saitozyma podzolica]|jgi:hypothetical protein|uniref:Uncharacterized protein n=1 Tax=Saitozyma podzolica TaxID=1890683 RepID=A0A427YD80_9TREE|nr:hypothetical protein EHS25_002710 [Saitozyma podzolica]
MDSDTRSKPWILRLPSGKVPVALGWTSSASIPAGSNVTSSPGSQADSAPHTNVIATVAFRAGVPSPLICHIVADPERENGVQTALAKTLEAFRDSLRSSARTLLDQQEEEDDVETGGEDDGADDDQSSRLSEELHWQSCDEKVAPRVTLELYEQMIKSPFPSPEGMVIRLVSEDEYRNTVSESAHHFSVASSRPDQSECGVGVGPETEPDPWALGTLPTPPEPQLTDPGLRSRRSMGSIWKRLRGGSSSPTPGQL